MSHFVTIQTRIRERALLERTLSDLHLAFRAAASETLPVRGYQGGRELAEIVVDTGTPYDIGFRRRAGEYEVVADWWGVQHGRIQREAFLRQVNQGYAYSLVREQAREQDLVFESEEVRENGDRVLVFTERG